MDDLRSQAWELAAKLEAIRTRITGLENGPGASLVAVIDNQLCASCGACVEACPAGAVTLSDVAQIDAGKCNGCAQCVVACPHGAISVHRA